MVAEATLEPTSVIAMLISVIVTLAGVIAYLYKQNLRVNGKLSNAIHATKEGFDTLTDKIERVWLTASHEIDLQNKDIKALEKACGLIQSGVSEVNNRITQCLK